jgi:hypothetical protein
MPNSDQSYAGDRIAYINARREAIRSRGAAAGGKIYRIIRKPAAERARWAGLDAFERIREKAYARFADMRAANREALNRIRSRLTTSDLDIPF